VADATGKELTECTLFSHKLFDLIYDKHQMMQLEQQTPDTENMSIAYWSSVYNKRPDIKELALFLIMIHSIPPTTVDVERIFKISKGMETEKRTTLLGSTKEIVTVLKSEMPTSFIPSTKWTRQSYKPTEKPKRNTKGAKN